MKLGKDGFWNFEVNSEIVEGYRLNNVLAKNVPESYRKAIGADDPFEAAKIFENLVLAHMKTLDVGHAEAQHHIAINLASFAITWYPMEVCQRVMELYPLCVTTSFGRLIAMSNEKTEKPVESDRVQLEKIMDCEDKDWEYFARTDPTPTLTLTARDFVSNGGGCLYWPQIHIGGYVDSISVVDCETGEEMLKPTSEADIASWSQPSTPYVVELRSDDNEPLTMEWVNSARPFIPETLAGWKSSNSELRFDVRRRNDKWHLWMSTDISSAWSKTIEVHTRGELRAICRALKAVVPL